MGEVPAFDKHFLDFPTGWRIGAIGRMNIFCPVIHSERIRETLTCAQLWSLFPPGLTRSINTAASDRLHMAQRHSAGSPDQNLVTYRYIYAVIAYRFFRRPQQGQVGCHLTQPQVLEMTRIRSKICRAVFHSAKMTCLYLFDTSKSAPHGLELFNKLKSFLQQPVTSTCRCLQADFRFRNK